MCNKTFFKGLYNLDSIPINFNDEIDDIVSVKKMKNYNKTHLSNINS